MLPDDLPEDMPSFLAQFGTDEQCREYLFKARWPGGFRCAVCGHGDAYALKTKIVYECVACRKQHSLLAGTIFEQTKTGLAKWFLAIYLVTSSKGGIAATELQAAAGLRQLRDRLDLAAQAPQGHGPPGSSAPGRARRGRRDLRRWPEARQARPGRRRQDPGRRGGRGRPRRGPRSPSRPAPARLAGRRLGREPGRLPRRPCRQAGDRGHRRLARLPRPAGRGLRPRAGQLSASRGDAALRLPGIHLVFSLVKRWLLGTHHGAVGEKHLPAYLDEYVFRFNRRTAKRVSHGFARLIEHAVRIKPSTYRAIVAAPTPA